MKQEAADVRQFDMREFDVRQYRSGYETPQDQRAEAVAISAWALFHGADKILTDDPEATAQTMKVMGLEK